MTPNATAIRQFRLDRKMSLQQLADQAQRSRSLLWRIESGQSGASEATLRQIAQGLAVPVAAINREEVS